MRFFSGFREMTPLNNASKSYPISSLQFHILFFIAPLLKIRFSVPVKRDETAIFNPRGETLKVGLQTALSSRFTGPFNEHSFNNYTENSISL